MVDINTQFVYCPYHILHYGRKCAFSSHKWALSLCLASARLVCVLGVTSKYLKSHFNKILLVRSAYGNFETQFAVVNSEYLFCWSYFAKYFVGVGYFIVDHQMCCTTVNGKYSYSLCTNFFLLCWGFHVLVTTTPVTISIRWYYSDNKISFKNEFSEITSWN